MATANQKKKATGTQKPKAKAPVKSASKSSAPKKNSATKVSKKPQKVAVKAPAAKKSPVKGPAKPEKKVPPVSSKPKTTSSTPAKAIKPKSIPAKKTSSAPAKVTAPAAGKKNVKAVAKTTIVQKNTVGTKAKKPVVKNSTGSKPAAVTPKKSSPASSSPKTKGQKVTDSKATAKPSSPASATPVKTASGKTPTKAVGKSMPVKGASADKKGKTDSPEPLQIKAEKAIREMEETMDLSKLRPRIQAGSSAPKPLIKHQPAPLPKLPEPTNTAKVKFQLEFEFRSSPKILFTSLSDSSGLAGWFADEVHTKDDVYTFSWEGGDSQAKLVAIRDLQLVRFQWLDDIADGTYFQFEIKEDDITSDIALVITDFALPGERETNIRLWESQVQKLRMLLGSL